MSIVKKGGKISVSLSKSEMPDTVRDGVPARGTNSALLVLLLGMLATGFPFTILTVALKLIADDLNVSESFATWSISAPMLLSAVCMPFLGKLGDLYGHKRVFVFGIAGSSFFALLCFFSWDIWSLISFRILSMVMAGATTPSAMALIFHMYDAEERTKAVSWWAMSGPGSAALGLIAGGPLVDFFGWRSVFLFQVVTGVVVFLAARALLPETGKRQAKFDHLGNALLVISLCLLLFVIGTFGDERIGPTLKAAMLLMSFAGLFLLYKVEGKVSEPIVPPFLLRQRNFIAPVSASFISQASYLGGFVVTPLLLIGTFGLSISLASLFMLLRTMSITLGAPVGGRLAMRIGERNGSMIGSSIQALGLFLVAAGAFYENLILVGVGLVLQGCGHGLALPPLTTVISYAVPSTLFGTASGVSRLVTQVGSSFGLSFFAALISTDKEMVNLPIIFVFGGVLSALAVLPAMAISMKHHRLK